MMKENADKVKEDEKNAIISAISALRTAMEGSSIDTIKNAKSELEKASHGFAERMYQEASQQQGGPAQGEAGAGSENKNSSASGSDEKVYDADYEVVDEDKK